MGDGFNSQVVSFGFGWDACGNEKERLGGEGYFKVGFAGDAFEGDGGAVAGPKDVAFDAPVHGGFGGVFDDHFADDLRGSSGGFNPEFGETAGAADAGFFRAGGGVGDVFAVG